MRIGAHVSVAGGLERAVGNATAVGCEALQVFVSNARGWAPPPVDPAAAASNGHGSAEHLVGTV